MGSNAFLFPGQGAQYVGMGKDFYDQFPLAKQTFQEADDLLESHFSKLIFEGPSEELTLTKNSQLAIYIVSVAIWRCVQSQLPQLVPSVCAGLSLGEYSALTAAGKISFADCLALVRARGLFMHEAAQTNPGTMSVILGLQPEEVERLLLSSQPRRRVWIANLNCPLQVVIAGTKEDVEWANTELKGAGAKRALPLDVSGAFHTELMRPAQQRLEPLIQEAALLDSKVSLVMNVPGGFVSDLSEVRRHLVNQVVQPVLWEKGVHAMMEKGISLYIEMGCGKTLQGMNKRIGAPVPTLSIEKIQDLEEVNHAITAG